MHLKSWERFIIKAETLQLIGWEAITQWISI